MFQIWEACEPVYNAGSGDGITGDGLLINLFYVFNLFFAVLGLRCCARALVAASRGYSSLRCAGFIAMASLVAEHRL